MGSVRKTSRAWWDELVDDSVKVLDWSGWDLDLTNKFYAFERQKIGKKEFLKRFHNCTIMWNPNNEPVPGYKCVGA
jgi:hypothetical protein